MENKRDYLWDNVKAVLIFLVVFGHCLELCSREISLAVYADRMIYCFHMPAFIFVSGFWAKRYCVDGKVRAEKAAVLFAYYLIFQIIFSLLTLAVAPHTRVSVFNPNRGLWYLLAVFAYYLLVPLIEKLPPWLVVGLSVVFSLLIGADKKNLGNYMALQRIITFAPFFFVGYYLKAETVARLRSHHIALRLAAAVSLAGAVAAALLIKRNALTMTLFYAKANYAKMHHTFIQGVALRGIGLVMAAMLTLALLLIVPSGKLFFSQTGKNSLQIFILHMSVITVLVRLDSFRPVINSLPTFALALVTAAAVTAVLSLNIFGYPFRWIQSGVKKLYK